jgi:hypothetical protein
MAKLAEIAKKEALTRALQVVADEPSPPTLYNWMRQHYGDLERILADLRPEWHTLAEEFAKLGIMDRPGRPASTERVRRTWWRLRTEMKRLEARNMASADAVKA